MTIRRTDTEGKGLDQFVGKTRGSLRTVPSERRFIEAADDPNPPDAPMTIPTCSYAARSFPDPVLLEEGRLRSFRWIGVHPAGSVMGLALGVTALALATASIPGSSSGA